PHFLQPIETELRLISESRSGRSRSHLVRKVPNADQQERYSVTMGLDELQVVARVPPSSGGIDHRPSGGEVAGESAATVHVRGEIDLGTRIVQVAGRSPKCGRDKVCAVPLIFIKVQSVGERRGIQVCRSVDFKTW